ncbi:hypothetical protein [Rhizobium sp. P32RR-XVIII]|nr:hypothetical protein [Rhizobium sp. P32RR-XVIII]
MAIAATDADWKKINSVFGSNVEGVAEIGSTNAASVIRPFASV